MKHEKKALAYLNMSNNYPYPSHMCTMVDAIRALDIHAQQIIGIVQAGNEKSDIIESIRKL